MVSMWFGSGGTRGRALRTGVLVAAQASALFVGAVGAHTLATENDPATWLSQRFASPAAEVCEVAPGAMSVADVAARVNPAVVTITNLQQNAGRGNNDDAAMPVGTGSGFIIDQTGRVVTNAHVVEGADELIVEFQDGATVPATLIGRDEIQDVAVIQLDLTDGTELPGVVTLGDSTTVRPGDQVVAIGSALGEFSNTVTEGTVNAVGRSLGGYGLSNLIQHDAEIWHGNSGGPLVNMQGEVIGVNSAGVSGDAAGAELMPARISFAIAINPVQVLVDDLIADGVVSRPYLGITGEPTVNGHLVVEVVEDGPAAAAGLRADDIITAINGVTLNRRSILLDQLFEYQPGDTVTLTVERDGQELTLEVVLGERPELTD